MSSALTLAALVASAAGPSTSTALAPGEGLTSSPTGKGLPNGSSSEEDYLDWLVPTQDPEYGYSKDKPVQVGGLLEGAGAPWSAQYLRSLLGPDGQATSFERVKSCCAFGVSDPKLVAAGVKVGFLDVYKVTVDNAPPVLIYVSVYEAGKIFAPKGFRTRGKAH